MKNGHIIPVKTGIQLIKNVSRSEAEPCLCPLRGLIQLLDSRFHGNESVA